MAAPQRRDLGAAHVERLVERAHRPESGPLRDAEIDPRVVGQRVRVDVAERRPRSAGRGGRGPARRCSSRIGPAGSRRVAIGPRERNRVARRRVSARAVGAVRLDVDQLVLGQALVRDRQAAGLHEAAGRVRRHARLGRAALDVEAAGRRWRTRSRPRTSGPARAAGTTPAAGGPRTRLSTVVVTRTKRSPARSSSTVDTASVAAADPRRRGVVDPLGQPVAGVDDQAGPERSRLAHPHGDGLRPVDDDVMVRRAVVVGVARVAVVDEAAEAGVPVEREGAGLGVDLDA